MATVFANQATHIQTSIGASKQNHLWPLSSPGQREEPGKSRARTTLSIPMKSMNASHSILHKSHNTPLLPPKNLHRHCFRLLLGHFHVPGEIANNGYAKVLGGNRGKLRDCASSVNIYFCFSRCHAPRNSVTQP